MNNLIFNLFYYYNFIKNIKKLFFYYFICFYIDTKHKHILLLTLLIPIFNLNLKLISNNVNLTNFSLQILIYFDVNYFY